MKLDAKNINYALIALTAFLIPLYQPLVRYAIGLLVISTFFNFKFEKKTLLGLSPLVFYFLWLIIGLTWSQNTQSGWNEIEYSLSFIIFPFVFGFTKLDLSQIISRIFSFFTFGYIASIIICMVLAIFNYYKTGDLKYFYYADLSYFHHPTYMALFGGAALIYLYLSLLDPSKVKTFYFKSGLSKFALISVISIFTLLLMSKAGILFALLINSIGIVAIFKSRQKLMQAFLIVSGLFLIVIGAYLTIKPLESRVNEAWSSITESGPKESSTGARILAWETSWQIIKQAPVFGVGTGDLSDELDQIYLEKGYNKLYEKSLNSHSQFFETWGKSGFIGLLSLIGLFIYAFTKIENYFYLLIALLIWSNMLMESMLQIQSGIVFIAFINSLFATAIINQKT